MKLEKRQGFTIESEQAAKQYPQLKQALIVWSAGLLLVLFANCNPPLDVITSWILWGTPIFVLCYLVDEKGNEKDES